MAQTKKSGTKPPPKGKSGGTAKSGERARQAGDTRPVRREVGAVVCLFLGIFSVIGYFEVHGWFIDLFSNLLKGLVGWGYYIFPPALFVTAYVLGFHRGRPVRFRMVSLLILPVFLGAFIHLILCRTGYEFNKDILKLLYQDGRAMVCGGVLSGLISMCFEAMFSIFGAVPVLVVGFVFFLLSGLNITASKIIEKIRNRTVIEYEPEPEYDLGRNPEPVKAGQRKKRRAVIDIPLDEGEEPVEYVEERVGFFNARPRVRTPDQIISGSPAAPDAAPVYDPPSPSFDRQNIPGIPAAAASAGETVVREIVMPPAPPAEGKIKKDDLLKESEEIAKTIESALESGGKQYEFPPVSLLKSGGGSTIDGREEVNLNRERLDATLKSFGVDASIAGVTRGPTVTRYDLELEAGVKLNKLTNLAGDLALSLGVSSVRIAPIPDKISTVGVEVPNKLVSTVYLHDIINSPEFRNARSRLSFAIGKDIGGNAIVGNISKLPHMLIAGTTGSGKSVCMNSLILSLLYKATPDEVRLIMIDPKMVELGIYNGIPNLFVPVVTDPKKAAGALQWSVVEMLKRYRLFSEAGVRDVSGYNAHQKRLGEKTIPQVVIVIDELADLMLVASKEVEESICRVAQMGRASGMHLIIATQRPSADVITGLMKANIPSRIAFAVSSAMESRIILDTQGAEKLIGAGDMLYSPIGLGKPVRIQGAFVTDDEREAVIRFIKSTSQTDYSQEILEQIEKAAADKPETSPGDGPDDQAQKSDHDELLPQAVEVILETDQASVSMLQRRLKLGYSRAARIVDQMEELGIVGPFEGSKPRQLLINRQQWIEMQSAQSGEDEDVMADSIVGTQLEFGTGNQEFLDQDDMEE